ncbi:MAG: NAD(P)H-dependent oxidoreductase [Simkaniaceae bacterium]|nr:NAD(P)H-dependent oxidoreductase [Simkaniaceae bacterium]
MKKVLVFSGSSRKESVNKMLSKQAAEVLKELGGSVTWIDLADYPMPIYNGDLEKGEGMPEKAQELKKLFLEHDALVIATPEYNFCITPLLKNTLDWVSRSESEDEPPLAAYQDKTVALISASPGFMGGRHSVYVVRSMLMTMGVNVIPKFFCLPSAFKKISHTGFSEEKDREKLVAVMQQLLAKL